MVINLKSFRELLSTRVIFFMLCLYPASLGGFSINYTFLLFFLYKVFFSQIFIPRIEILFAILFYFTIYVFGQIDILSDFDNQYFIRSNISFYLFILPFLFCFIRLSEAEIDDFKIALILFSSIYGLFSSISFFILGADIHFEVKDILGSNRVGFIFIAAFWVCMFNDGNLNKHLLFKNLSILLISAGLLLTFSRASIFALLGSIILYLVFSFISILISGKFIGYKRKLGFSIIGVAFLFILTTNFSLTFEFFNERMFKYLLDPSSLVYLVSDYSDSLGIRVLFFKEMLNFVYLNPLIGSGYLGPWILENSMVASSHNQFIDTIFRTGIIGFVIYTYLLIMMGYFYFSSNKLTGLFWAFVGMLLYGLFHETFKESAGAFIFAIMISIAFNSIKYPTKNLKTNKLIK